ncbi:MAG TPA: hypothetical protein VI864_03445 [Candidatus Bathyarchaeia archaeon]|nr:hypothetical protein [Candidatus Bathyarchaeia archaeon]
MFVTREINPWVITPGLIALFCFFIILRGVLLFGQSSTASFLLVYFGSIAFLLLLLHPAVTKIKVTEDGIDWKALGLGVFIHFDEIKEVRVSRFCLKLDTGAWWKPTMCPVDRKGFLLAIQEAKPDIKITGRLR